MTYYTRHTCANENEGRCSNEPAPCTERGEYGQCQDYVCDGHKDDHAFNVHNVGACEWCGGRAPDGEAMHLICGIEDRLDKEAREWAK